ncbi:hypothetical protein NQ315_012361 [Exocentrus adspersus]|uniref:Uncharacterized protein n=1 Tax=Exocentrus adspersus TaxID=1586481 RepID=A0AAV8VC62_9CUCU|nr:hypothetical protein NQ315_012361 [Exocentrus adspersus]
MTFGAHVTVTCKKAEATLAALGRIMPNCKGPKQQKRKTLAGVGRGVNNHHTVFECARWIRERTEMEIDAGEILTPESIIENSIQDQEKWESILGRARRIMERQERDLRQLEERA